MKFALAAAALGGLALFAAHARGGPEPSVPERRIAPAEAPTVAWADLPRSLGAPAGTVRVVDAEAPDTLHTDSLSEVDVVDAHWMALTMWGEARGQSEAAMRAVGHVIDNRRRAGGRHGAFVTETVSEAWQFSCWNPGDPNLAAIRNIEALPQDSREYRLWRAARRIAEEILAGRSRDPTGGALFYHADHVAPKWSRGLAPVTRIGGHLFFRHAR